MCFLGYFEEHADRMPELPIDPDARDGAQSPGETFHQFGLSDLGLGRDGAFFNISARDKIAASSRFLHLAALVITRATDARSTSAYRRQGCLRMAAP